MKSRGFGSQSRNAWSRKPTLISIMIDMIMEFGHNGSFCSKGPPGRSQLDKKYRISGLFIVHMADTCRPQLSTDFPFAPSSGFDTIPYKCMATRVGIPRNRHLKQGVETNYSLRFALKGVPHLGKCTLCLRRYRNCLPSRYATMHLRSVQGHVSADFLLTPVSGAKPSV